MSKTTNKQQIDIFLNAMQMRPDIARNFFKGNKEELNMFWRNLETQLNSAGAPTKNVSEWKKVWADQKKYVRHKAAQNLKASKATGGGPNVEQKFSATEDTIYNLIGIQESVEGVAKTFGLSSSSVTTASENIPPNIPTIDEVLHEYDLLKVNAQNIDQDTCQPPEKKTRKSAPRELATQKSSTADILVEELKVQKDICEAMRDQQQNTKKIYRSLDRLYELQKHHFETMEKAKNKEFEKQKRHNMVMERLRIKEVEDKIEKNRRVLELKELKYKY